MTISNVLTCLFAVIAATLILIVVCALFSPSALPVVGTIAGSAIITIGKIAVAKIAKSK